MRSSRLWPLALVFLTACSGEEPRGDVPAEPTAADTVAMAAEAFDAAAFDTVTWENDEEAWVRGSVVYSYSCAKCHGRQGYGDARFVTQGDTLEPPSFHQEDWRFADDPLALRQFIFTGSEGGMPHWGLEGLKAKDIDAVARFIAESLRDQSGDG